MKIKRLGTKTKTLEQIHEPKFVPASKPTIVEMMAALNDIGFYIGGLTDQQIEHWYNKLIKQ